MTVRIQELLEEAASDQATSSDSQAGSARLQIGAADRLVSNVAEEVAGLNQVLQPEEVVTSSKRSRDDSGDMPLVLRGRKKVKGEL